MKESSPQRLREHRGAGFKPRYPKNDSVLSVSLTTLRSVHVRCATIVVEIHFSDFSDSLAGEISRETCEELIVFATRQYAKRQETWFRRERWLKRLEFY